MSDSESEHLSTTSECSREDEVTTSRGRHQARKKRKVMSSSSEKEENEEEEDEEEEEEEKQQPVGSRGASADSSEDEERKSPLSSIQEATALGGPRLNEGDDDGDSVDSDSSSEVPGAETCAICLGRMRGEVGSPESCDHTFCLLCILEWAKTNASCPQDRKAFSKVLVRMTLGAEAVEREVSVQKEAESEVVQLPEADNPTYCEVCHECDREERLLLCDGCDLGYHLECLDPPLMQVPVEEWFCPMCVNANINSTLGVQPASQGGESSTSRGRPRRQQSSSQRPRLIPRTRATERVRERVIRKRREKRKRRKLSRKRRIESGELDDPRPPVEYKERLMYFGNLTTDLPSNEPDDKFADQLLACGSGFSSNRIPGLQKADAARILRESAFTPLSSYVGKASSAVMNRVNIQAEEAREDDVLSSILENQSIVLTNSKKLSLTSDRKFKMEGEGSDAEAFRLEKEENPLMSEPLPSRRPPPKDGEGSRSTSQEDDRRHSSPPRGPHSRYPHHSFYPRNSGYRHPPRGYNSNHRMQRDERVCREERIQREESLSGMVHHSPLEDRRRSPPRLSYQRQRPLHQYRNQRNFHPDYRNRDPPSHRDERQRYQRSPPWRDSAHRQNQSSDSRWERRHAESSGSSNREPSSQERHGRNGRESSRDDSDRSSRPLSDKKGNNPGFGMHDKYPHRNEDSRREDDRSRKEDRGYHRHHHHRDHSDHRSYRSTYRTDRESPSPHSSQRSRSYSRSPVRSKSPNRSRSPLKSRSPMRSEVDSRSRETHSRGWENSERRKKARKPSNDNESAHRMSLSPAQPEEASLDDQQQESQRDTSGYDSISDAKLSPHSSKSQEPPTESPLRMFDDSLNKEMTVEDKPSSIKNGVNEDKSCHSEVSPKVSKEKKKEWDAKKYLRDRRDSNVVDQRRVSRESDIKEEEVSDNFEGNRRLPHENEVNDSGMETPDDLLNDAKKGGVMVQNSCKEEHKREKSLKDIKIEDSRKSRNGYDTHPFHSGDSSEDTDKKQAQNETEDTVKEGHVERKKRKRLIPGSLGRVLEYTPEVELSHWDDEDSSVNFPSPFKVIKKTDASESDKSITLPLSLQRLLPGNKSILKGIEDRKKTSREKSKHRADPDRREKERRSSLCDEVHRSRTESHDMQRPEKRDANSVTKKEEKSRNKSHKKSTEGHKPPKVDMKLHSDKSKDVVSPSSSQSSSSSGRSRQKSSEKATTKDSHTLVSQRKESAIHSDSKQEKDHDQEETQSTSQINTLTTRTPQKHKHKKEPEEKVKVYNSMFGDISDVSGSDFDDELSKKPVKQSCIVEKHSEKQDAQERKDKHVHSKTKGADEISDIEMKIIKCDSLLKKSSKKEAAVLPGLMSSPHKGAVKAKSQNKTTKYAGLNKDHVMNLFGSSSDSDDAEGPEANFKETNIQKMQKPHKSSPIKSDAVHRARDGADSNKRKERKHEKGNTPDKETSEKLSKSTSSESLKSDSVHKNENETTDGHTGKDRNNEQEISMHKSISEEESKSNLESPKTGMQKHKSSKEAIDNHKEKDRKGEQESSLHKKSSEKTSDSTLSELPRGSSSHKKMKEAADTHREKNKKCEKETSLHQKSLENTTQGEAEVKKRRETTDSHKEQDRHSQEALKKDSGKPKGITEHHDNDSDHRKAFVDTHIEEQQKSKTNPQATTEAHSKSKAGGPVDVKGKTHNDKERKSSTEEKILKGKDPASKTESKPSVATPHPSCHTLDKREKKDAGDVYAKLKASLELKVVAEVKKWLDPHYRDKSITKEEYKEIVAKCVTKVVSAECGDVIESEKMRSLVEGYVKLYRHRRAKQQPPPSS